MSSIEHLHKKSFSFANNEGMDQPEHLGGCFDFTSYNGYVT